jgi:hypothetical protein
MKKTLVLLILLFTIFCKKEKKVEISETDHTSPTNLEIFKEDALETKIDLGEVVSIDIKGKIIKGTLSENKSIFKDDKGNTIFEIKYTEDYFRLLNEKGDLLWKIKIDPDEFLFLIANNNEMKNPMEIKKISPTSLKLEKNNSELGIVSFDSVNEKIVLENSNNANFIKSKQLLISYGIYFLPEITELQKLVILSEAVHIQ